MTLDELMEVLEIENLDEFEFFEHFSALMEYPEEIEFDLFSRVLSEVDSGVLYELTDNYFEDMIQGVPDDSISLYTMLYTIRTALCEAAKEADSPAERSFYIEELFRFRTWYLFDSIVKCRRFSDGQLSKETLFEALALYRLEKLGEEKYDYDFSHALEYSIDDLEGRGDDYEYKEERDDDEDEDFDDTLIDRDNPVIDGENYDEEEENDDEDY